MYPKGLHVAGVTEDQKPINYCLSCERYFSNSAEHRIHMRSEWHCYNLRRKVAILPPISEGQFKLIVESNMVKTETAPSKFTCTVCGKIYRSSNALSNHLNSKRHQLNKSDRFEKKIEKQLVIKAPREKDWRSLLMTCKSADEVRGIVMEKNAAYISPPDSLCLFCDTKSEDLELNLKHMYLEHGFSLPLSQHRCDKRGLILHLAEKIGKYNMCIYCNGRGKTFYDSESVKKHMKSLKHCCINPSNVKRREYRQFYNLSNAPNYRYVVRNFITATASHVKYTHAAEDPFGITNDNAEVCDKSAEADDYLVHNVNSRQTTKSASSEHSQTDDEEYYTDSDADESQSVDSSKIEIIFVNSSLDTMLLPRGDIVPISLSRTLTSRRKMGANSLLFSPKHVECVKPLFKSRTLINEEGNQPSSLSGPLLTKRTKDILLKSSSRTNLAVLKKRLSIGVTANKLQKHFRSQIGFGS